MDGDDFQSGGTGARIALFALAYFCVTSLTIAMTRFGGGLALVWPSSALLAALLLTLPRRHTMSALLSIGVASAIATALFGIGPTHAVPMAIVNMLEGLIIAYLLLAVRPQRDWLTSRGGLIATLIVCGFAGPFTAALPGALIVRDAVGGDLATHAIRWVASHGLGTLLAFTPVMLIAGGDRCEQPEKPEKTRWLELAAHSLVVGGVSYIVMFQAGLPLLFVPTVPLLIMALRLGRTGAAIGTCVVAVVAALSFASPEGFFHGPLVQTAHKVLFLQFYLAVLLLIALPAAVAMKQIRMLVQQLEEKKALEGLAAEHGDDALLNLGADGRIRYASPAALRLSGEDDLTGHPLTRFFDPLDEPLVRGMLAGAAAGPGELRVLERPVLCGEEQLWLQAKLRAVFAKDKQAALQGYAVSIRDVTQRKRTELDAIEAAETDALTGLPNRRALLVQLDRALRHAPHRPFALGIVDLDHFKDVNDRHGHGVGDEVLREVAAVMRRISGPSALFARLGGEEFAVVLRQPDFTEAERLCERLRQAIAAITLTAPDGAPLSATASIGLAHMTQELSPAQALEAADALLYAAKHAGRDRVVSAGQPSAGPHARAA